MRGPMRVRRGFQGGRKTAGDGIDNPYRVEGRVGAEPQVAAASQRQPGARVDKPFRLGADGGRGHPGTRANRWRSKALSDAFVPVSVEGVVGRVRTGEGRGRCRTRSHRAGLSPASRQPPDPYPPGGEDRRTWGVSPMVNARPPHPRVERAADLQSQRSKMRRSQVRCARHAFTSQLTLAVRRRNLKYGASAVFPCGVIPATDPHGRAPALGRLTNYGSRVI